MKIVPFVITLFFLVIQVASAATLVFSGRINEVDVGFFPGVTIGDAFQLDVDYDPSFLDDDPSSDSGLFLLPSQSIVLAVDGSGVVFESIGGSLNIRTNSPDFPGDISILGSNNDFSLIFILQDNAAPTIVDDRIPDPFPTLDDFDVAGFSIITNGIRTGNGRLIQPELSGSVLAISVPEPQISLLVAVGCLTGWKRRRSRSWENKTEKPTPHRS